MPSPRPRPYVDGLPAYRPGRSAEEAAVEHGVSEAVKLASNEMPYGPSTAVVKAIEVAAAGINRYPDHQATALRDALAVRLGVGADRVTVGCGSVSLLQQIAAVYTGPGDRFVYGWRSFEAYPIVAQLAGAEGVGVPLRRQTIDGAALLGAVDERTKVVVVANANNPTSTALRTRDLMVLADGIPDHCLLVVDEAYREFATGVDVPDALQLLGGRDNVVVVRTFSKAYGLAGLRVGYLVGPPDVVAAVDKVVTPFSVNRVAQAAALAALEADDEMTARVAAVVSERARVAGELRRRGFTVPDSQANFVWLPVGGRAEALGLDLERRGIVTRPFAGDGVRVTIGTPDENDHFLAAVGDDAGAGVTPAAEWLERLDAVESRLVELAGRRRSGLTGADPKTGEQWDDGQVWAHVAEFGDYWIAQLDQVVDAAGSAPVPFGRVKTDDHRIAAIEAGRADDPATHLAVIRGSIDRLRTRLAELTPADWGRVGRHSTLGDMDVAAQLQHFHVGHYEEHADQLEELPAR